MKGASTRVIDVHAHYVPPGLRDYVRRYGGPLGLELVEGPHGTAVRTGPSTVTRPVDPLVWDLEERVRRMDACGVDVQALSLWTDLLAGELPPAAVGAMNDLLAEDVASLPDRFLGLGAVPVQAPELAPDELRRAVVELGFVGIELAASLDGPDLGSAAFEPLWEAAEELRCLVLLHPVGSLGAGLADPRVEVVFGRPAETTLVAGRLILAGVLERHPGLNLCVVHGGGFLPYQLGRAERAHRLSVGTGNPMPDPRVALGQLLYDTVLNSPAALRLLIDEVGAERVLLGTDDPFEGGDPTPRATVDAIPGLSARDRLLLLGGNAERLFEGIRRPTDRPSLSGSARL